jgi:DtxR family Mn-dependent transcriptional regulator
MEIKLSPSKEDYLKAIHLLNTQSGGVRVKDIARKLDITMPSVSYAIKALEKQGLVSHPRYDLVALTSRGSQIAKIITRRNRIIRDFLSDVLELDQKIAERDACVMEHSISPETLEKFIRFMEDERK